MFAWYLVRRDVRVPGWRGRRSDHVAKGIKVDEVDRSSPQRVTAGKVFVSGLNAYVSLNLVG